MTDQHRRVPLALRIAAKLLPSDARDDVLGDLLEAWREREQKQGRWSARLWTLRQPIVAIASRAAFRTQIPGQPRAGTGLAFSWIDVRLGFRMLGKQPILSAVAALTLALGIPAALIPTHIIDSLDSDLPVEEGERVLGLRNWDVRASEPASSRIHDFAGWREALRAFEELGAARSEAWNVHSPDGRAADVRGAEVTASIFSILRVPPLLGRTLLPSDEIDGAPDVVVISADLWESRFAGDPEIIGRTIGIGRRPHTVVGVMPAGFYFPIDDHLWLPLRADPSDYAVGAGPDLLVIGRLADGVSESEASAELSAVGTRLRAEWPETHADLRAEVRSYPILLMGEDMEGGDIILLQIVCFSLLAIACGNVGTLILARTATRMSEISVRTALGASRTRILSQLFAESLVLALGATAVGLVGAQLLVTGVVNTLLSGELPYWIDLDLTPRMVLIAFGLGSVCAVVAGVLPAIKATSPRIQENLQAHARGTTLRFGPLTSVLTVAEVAWSVGFLCFGSAAFGAFMADRSDDAGLDLDRYLIAQLRTPWIEPTRAEADSVEAAFQIRATANQDELLARLTADRDVRRVAMGVSLPGIGHADRSVVIDGAGDETAMGVQGARVHFDYFRDFDIDVLQGRTFTSADVEGLDRFERRSVVVNDQFVRDVFGGGDALGRVIRFADPYPGESGVSYEIVGVVETFGTNLVDPDRAAAVYHPLATAEVHPISYIIEVDGDATSFIPRLREIAAAVDPDAIVERPAPVAELVAQERFEMRTVTLFVFVLSAVGMLLAATGLYALLSFTVSQRTREIGIRTALGAESGDVIATVARRALAQLLIGVALGSWGGWVLVRINAETFFVDNVPGLVAGVAAAVIVFSALACLPPVRRGLRIQPTEALREV
jgi:predicted permease